MNSIEEKILEKKEDIYAEKVFEAIGNMTGEDGKICNLGAWRQLIKIDPNRKKQQLVPTAFKDKHGNLISNHEGIKNLCLDNILNRLIQRPIYPELIILENRKLLLSKMRLLKATRRKTLPWTLQQMEKAIRSLKNRKCRDGQGTINEIIKQGVAGHDFKMSLLSLLNYTKKHLQIPQMMKIVNIALIPKPGKEI